MSHSKTTKRGKSLYIDKWNPAAKRFINTCKICGAQGYAPTIEADGFVLDGGGMIDGEHRAIRAELKKTFKPLELDAHGRCSHCAERMDNG